LTRKGAFKWSDEAQLTFEKMKKVTRTCPVLTLPYFSHPFILECDASREGVWVVLVKNKHPIDFERIKLRGIDLLYTIYDKDMLSVMHALEKFRKYLVGAKFVVKIYHNNLKYFLAQKDLNERKQKWVSKIQAYDFDIEFIKGKNNVVVDSLSRIPSVYSMSKISAEWKSHWLVEYSKNKFSCKLMDGKVQDDR
jgi:hypothetical protein